MPDNYRKCHGCKDLVVIEGLNGDDLCDECAKTLNRWLRLGEELGLVIFTDEYYLPRK